MKFAIVLPINILIAVIVIIVGAIIFSLIFEYVNISENINNKIKVYKNEIITSFKTFKIGIDIVLTSYMNIFLCYIFISNIIFILIYSFLFFLEQCEFLIYIFGNILFYI